MNVQISKEELFPLLSQVQGILEKKSTLPIFVNVLIMAKNKDEVQIYASDSELSFSACFSGKVKKPGSLVVNGKKLFEIVRELSSDFFDLSLGKNYQVTLKQNQSLFKIHGLNPEDFPCFPPLKQEKKQYLLVEDILNVIDKTLYCVSLDESRYHLTGVFLELVSKKYRFVATDGHRMSFVDISGEKNEELKEELKEGIIIPRKGLQELKKMLSKAEEGDRVEFCVENPRLLVRFKNQMLSIRLIEGQYPDYKSLLPKQGGKEIVISTEAFLSSLRRISVLTSARFKGVDFTFQNHSLHIQFSHPEVGEAFEELACEYEGEELKVRFNSKYILDVLQSIYDEKLRIFLKDGQSPGLIRAENKSSYTCLIMPMKL